MALYKVTFVKRKLSFKNTAEEMSFEWAFEMLQWRFYQGW